MLVWAFGLVLVTHCIRPNKASHSRCSHKELNSTTFKTMFAADYIYNHKSRFPLSHVEQNVLLQIGTGHVHLFSKQ